MTISCSLVHFLSAEVEGEEKYSVEEKEEKEGEKEREKEGKG